MNAINVREKGGKHTKKTDKDARLASVKESH